MEFQAAWGCYLSRITEFPSDRLFLRPLAFNAWRNHKLPAAQSYLLELMQAAAPIVAARSLRSFRDVHFQKQSLDERLLESCRLAI